MSKRKYEEYVRRVDDVIAEAEKPIFKNSLDSDEEDDEANEDRANQESYNVVSREIEDIERETRAPTDTETGFTAFNMKEEMEEGHFDKDGHYHWKKEKEIRDNWLDDIDWVKIKAGTEPKAARTSTGLADSDSDDDGPYDPNQVYEQIVAFLKPGESINKALRRLGKGKKPMTSAERWKRKKDPNASKEDDESTVQITKLTELANELLTRTGNMDVYEETYEQIKSKLNASLKREAESDMFSDDFDAKDAPNKKVKFEAESTQPAKTEKITWEFKWSQSEEAKVHGPHTSEEMHAWAKEGFFKKGAWVRKIGQQTEFYNATRIDFELYCD